MGDRWVVARQTPEGMDLGRDYVALPDNYVTDAYFQREDICLIRKTVFDCLDRLEEHLHFTPVLSASARAVIKPNLVSVYHHSGPTGTDYPESIAPQSIGRSCEVGFALSAKRSDCGILGKAHAHPHQLPGKRRGPDCQIPENRSGGPGNLPGQAVSAAQGPGDEESADSGTLRGCGGVWGADQAVGHHVDQAVQECTRWHKMGLPAYTM